MKILLDNCLDVRVKSLLAEHEVLHARDMGWRDLGNGKLLAAAAVAKFDVMLTVDKNIRSQQNLAKLPLAVIEIDVLRNRLKDISPLAPRFSEALERTKQHLFVSVKGDGSIECLAERGRAV